MIQTCLMAACKNGTDSSSSNKIDSTLTAEDVYKQSISKVAMIISYRDGITYAQGTGFFIEKIPW